MEIIEIDVLDAGEVIKIAVKDHKDAARLQSFIMDAVSLMTNEKTEAEVYSCAIHGNIATENFCPRC